MLIKDRDAARLPVVRAMVAGRARGHPDLARSQLERQSYRGGIQSAHSLVQDQAAVNADAGHALRNEPRALDGGILVRLDEHRSHARIFGCARELQVIEAPAIDVRSAVYVQIHSAFQVIRQMAHAFTLRTGSSGADSNSVLAIHPAMADTAAASATVLIGMVKLAVCCVTRPTAHMARAPAREPQPLRTPSAVDGCVLETSCVMVR